jgi:hypothetical protein
MVGAGLRAQLTGYGRNDSVKNSTLFILADVRSNLDSVDCPSRDTQPLQVTADTSLSEYGPTLKDSTTTALAATVRPSAVRKNAFSVAGL